MSLNLEPGVYQDTGLGPLLGEGSGRMAFLEERVQAKQGGWSGSVGCATSVDADGTGQAVLHPTGILNLSQPRLPLQCRSPWTEVGRLEATPRTLRRKMDRVTSRHILEREIEAEVPIASMLSRGQLAESTAESLQSMA